MNQIREFSSCALDLGPREAAHLPVSWVRSAYGALRSREEGITYSNNPSVCPSRASLETQSQPPRPWHCLRQSFPGLLAHLPFNLQCLTHDAELGLSSSSPRLSGPCCLPDSARTWGPSPTFWGVSPWRLPLWHAWELLHQSISCSHSLMVLHLSTSSLSSATMLSRSSTCSPLTQVQFLPPSSTSASRLRHSLQPEAGTATFLGRASVWVATVFAGQAGCLVETVVNLWPRRDSTYCQ